MRATTGGAPPCAAAQARGAFGPWPVVDQCHGVHHVVIRRGLHRSELATQYGERQHEAREVDNGLADGVAQAEALPHERDERAQGGRVDGAGVLELDDAVDQE